MRNNQDANILEELYFGNIDPNAQSFDRTSNFGKAMQVTVDTEEELLKLLEGREKQLFRDFVAAQSEIVGITAVEKFVKGFKLGARIGLEILSDEDSCLRDIT